MSRQKIVSISRNRLEFNSMDKIFQRIIDNNLADFKGLKVDASIPVPEHIINGIIELALQENKSIDYCLVSIGGENRVTVNLKTPLWPWPLKLKLRLFKLVDLTSSPKIRAFLENYLLLGRMGSFLKALPNGINIRGDQVIVDIKSFLQDPEQERILDLIKSAEIQTEEGKAIINVRIEVGG